MVWLKVPALGDLHRPFLRRERVDQPQRRVPRSIRDERDAAAVRRPARVGVVVIAVGQRKRITARRRQQPQLLPLPSEIAAVDDPRAVRRDVGPRVP